MRTANRVPRSLLRALLVAIPLFAATAAPAAGGLTVAHAEEDPLKAGTTLVARADCELQKVVITRGAKVEITKAAGKLVDVLLPDGFVLKRIPASRIRFFFDVVR